jgi:predicted transcriptional regulator
VLTLSRALDRPYRRVHGDVTALEGVGLVVRRKGSVAAAADRVAVEAILQDRLRRSELRSSGLVRMEQFGGKNKSLERIA